MASQQYDEDSKMLEEPGQNNNFDVNVLEKLKKIIPPIEANKYKNVCDIFDELLDTGLYSYYEETCDTHQVFLTGWILKEKRSPEEVLILVKHIFQIVIEKDSLQLVDQLPTRASKNMISWLVITTLMSLSQIPNLILENTWEGVLYELLRYIRHWGMDAKFSVYSLTYRTVNSLKNNFCWEWMIETACSPAICPSPYLRLEIFRVIHLFDPGKMIFSNGMKIVTAYVECMSSINPEQLFVIMGNNLLAMRHLMLHICTLSLPWRLKHLISGKVVNDLHLNHIGKEVRFVANSLKVIGIFAQIAKTRFKARSKFLRRCLNLCMYLFMFGHNNDFSENIYNHKLLLPYTYCALADITDGILTLSATMNYSNIEYNSEYSRRVSKKRMSLYNKIVKRRNDLVDDLKIPKEQFMHVKLSQREQSSNFRNILFVKSALALPKLELGTICSDDIEPMSFYHNEEADDSHVDSDTTESDDDSNGDSIILFDDNNSNNSDSILTGHSTEYEENSDEGSSSSVSRNDTASIYSIETDNESS